MAPATPPPRIRSLLAALTMASVSISVRSPCVRMIFSSRVMATSSRRISRADESRGFARDDHFLAHAAAHFAASFDGVAGRGGREDNFEKPPLGRSMEETHPDALLPAKRDGGHIRNGERRRTAGKDRAGLCEPVEPREYLDLDLHFLRNSFDHKIGLAASLFDGSRRRKQRQHVIFLLQSDLPSRDPFLERSPNPFQSLCTRRRRHIFQNRSIATERGSAGNAAAHRSRANHCNYLYIHRFTSGRKLWVRASSFHPQIHLGKEAGGTDPQQPGTTGAPVFSIVAVRT